MSNLNLPHQFEQLRVGKRPPFLVIGAGLSSGLVPLPPTLLQQYRSFAEYSLGCTTATGEHGPRDLYQWADQIVGQLKAAGSPAPKLRLAKALGMLTEACWLGKVGVALAGAEPRHRVIARLVREGRWVRIWSLNWDCHLENALEEIGYHRGEPRTDQPWITAYKSIVLLPDFPEAQRNDLFCIFKPHGCIRAIVKADERARLGDLVSADELSERFMITASELETERTSPTDETFFIQLKALLTSSPMMVVGWSISDPYLRAVINDTIKPLVARKKIEEFTVIDIGFGDGHAHAADCYELDKQQCFAEVERSSDGVDLNRFFLWIQARYALDHLKQHSSDAVGKILDQWGLDLAKPADNTPLVSFADHFLPSWVRLCWRAGIVSCQGFQPDQLRVDLENEHIPLNLPRVQRDDLLSAALLLAALPRSGNVWDCSMFPGALWNRDNQRLVLPLPSWMPMNDLAAIKPLLTNVGRQKAFVTQVDILPMVNQSPWKSASNEAITQLKNSVANEITMIGLADAGRLGVASDFYEA